MASGDSGGTGRGGNSKGGNARNRRSSYSSRNKDDGDEFMRYDETAETEYDWLL